LTVTDLSELWVLVRSIPAGKVSSYGDIGRALEHPASGFEVGRRMEHCPDDVPWWRVVGKNGHFPIGRRDPRLAKEQWELLAEEGVESADGMVDMGRFRHAP
jgi:methylated-DNA-protein-cysteine methyltransferase-like protein